jgi:peptidyl-tRNA hydrolase, PTH1 family
MDLIVGLGNPGEKYESTRHNIGFVVADALAFEISKQLPNTSFKFQKKLQSLITVYKSLVLAKPTTFMNSSGLAVRKLAAFYKIQPDNIWVIHDDLDLRLGEYKIQKGVGPKLHYGIFSIEKELGTSDFWRARIGVDNRINDKEKRIKGEDYVLQEFNSKERGVLGDVISKFIEELTTLITKG